MTGKRILALTTDSFGGLGGIASYARDTIRTMAARPDIAEVVVLTLVMPDDPGRLPRGVRLIDKSAAGKAGYAAEAARLALAGGFDAIWTAHAALAPLGRLAASRSRVKLGVSLHGSEVWARRGRMSEWAMAGADLLMPVSRITLDRFIAARGGSKQPFAILPGMVDLARFTPGPKPAVLAARHGVEDKRVLLTVSRIGKDWREKGFDRLIAQLPPLIERWPDLMYLIVGDGSERRRIATLVVATGLERHVRVTGYVAQTELADYYRLADVFILPSSGEGLGIVLLEAQACGVPAIASSLDGGAEAIAGMGWAVDPGDPAAVEQALGEAFARGKGRLAGIESFGKDAFEARMNAAIDLLLV